ncbi:unnamed protein product [Periconia digitata]|uniref:Uncharacterized protein n=1 Tax=Periconia digitata TaxID=1303443 RepID=A0A9W4UF50_9PLEO|nr:unnamed protein product [Periconia digitata]
MDRYTHPQDIPIDPRLFEPIENTPSDPNPPINTGANDAASQSMTLPPLHLDKHPTIPNLYKTFVEGFQQGKPNEVQLEHAKQLASALLEHYYPKSQGFSVDPVSSIDIARNGWNFWLAPADYQPFPQHGTNSGGPLDPSKPFMPDAEGNEPAAPNYTDVYVDDQHLIEPELITFFRVSSEQEFYEDGDDNNNSSKGPGEPVSDPSTSSSATNQQQQPLTRRTIKKQISHTYFAILMDDLSTFDRWVPDHMQRHDKLVSNPRQDILRYALGVLAGISKGYGFLLLGPRLEVYNYDWQGQRRNEDDPNSAAVAGSSKNKKGKKSKKSKSEPKTNCTRFVKGADPEPMSQLDGPKWFVDVREEGLDGVQTLMGDVVERDVEYQDNFVCDGSRLDWGDEEGVAEA